MYWVTVCLFGGFFLGWRGGIKLFIDTRRAVNKVKTFYNDLVAIFIFFDMAKWALPLSWYIALTKYIRRSEFYIDTLLYNILACNVMEFTTSTPLLWLMNMVLTLFYKNFNSLAKITIHDFWLIESLKLQCQLQRGLSNCLVTNIIIYWSIMPWTNLGFYFKIVHSYQMDST